MAENKKAQLQRAGPGSLSASEKLNNDFSLSEKPPNVKMQDAVFFFDREGKPRLRFLTAELRRKIRRDESMRRRLRNFKPNKEKIK